MLVLYDGKGDEVIASPYRRTLLAPLGMFNPMSLNIEKSRVRLVCTLAAEQLNGCFEVGENPVKGAS